MNARSGSFDIIRLLAAFMVLWSHHFVFTGLQEAPLLDLAPSSIGVYTFFAISGYLNVKSVISGASWWQFLLRRARRIFPALFAFAIFCVLLGSVVTTRPDVFWTPTLDFVYRNTTMLFGIRYSLPGVFEANTLSKIINGSLWTLPNEIKLYAYLAIAAALTRYRPTFLLAVLAFALLSFMAWEIFNPDPEGRFNKLAILFLTGGVFALIEKIKNFKVAAGLVISFSLFYTVTPSAAVLLPLIACVAILLGSVSLPKIVQPTIDISYGIYLYAFPIQQFVSTFSQEFWPTLVVSSCLTIFAAILSAIFIEQPALRKWTVSRSFRKKCSLVEELRLVKDERHDNKPMADKSDIVMKSNAIR